MSYGENRPAPGEPVIQLHYGENAPIQRNISTNEWQTPNNYLGHESSQHASGVASSPNSGLGRIHLEHFLDVGIFKDTLLPNIVLQGGLGLAAWGVARQYNRLEVKDGLWGAGMVINAWWSAVGRRLARGEGLGLIRRTISWPEGLLLAGVTAWGSRLTYRVVQRGMERGEDSPRYKDVKKEEGFWNKALLTTFLPEALFQAVIALPFTAPFRHQGGVMTGYQPLLQASSVALFTAGFSLEVIADYQLAQHQAEGKTSELKRDGVWSIVRHPNYLGDALMHLSFPLLLFSYDMLAPVELLGPIANYVFLRYFAGVEPMEQSQEARYTTEAPAKKAQLDDYRKEKNLFWPSVAEFQNQWTWIVLGTGAAGVVVERSLRAFFS